MIEGLSVVLCCYNSLERIKPTLEHLAMQDFEGKWEVVLVDNNSTDGTAEKVLELWKSLANKDNLRVIRESKPGLRFARASGADAAEHELLVFCDDDNWLDRSYLTLAYSIYNEECAKGIKIGFIGGIGYGVTDGEFPSWFNDFKLDYATGAQGELGGYITNSKGFVYGAGMITSKKCLSDIERLPISQYATDRSGTSLSSGGDLELCVLSRFAGYEIYYSPKLKFKHFIPESRLSVDYLKKLHRGFGFAAALNQPQQIFLRDPKVKFWKLRWSWLLFTAYKMYFFKRIANKSSSLINETDVIRAKGYADCILNNRKLFTSIYRELNSVKKNLV